MDKRQSRIIILICLVISVVIVFFGSKNSSRPKDTISISPSVAKVQAATLTSVSSPDGKMSLTMKQRKEEEGLVAFAFLLKDVDSGIQKEIFTKTVPREVSVSIPDNTFSSDNKYVFLKEKNSGTASYIVLTPSGTLDVSNLFTAKHQNYVITDATGWAGPTLLVINTDKVDGGIGPSFWFDVASKSFIQLSNRFN